MERLGLVSVSFREYSPRQILEAMQKCGLSRVEWGSDVHCPPEKAALIGALQREYGISCCAYGTYFRLGVTPIDQLQSYIDGAKQLGTSVLRLWCGDQNSEDHTPSQRQALFAQCKEAARIAEANGVTLCLECHNKTYTNRKEAALALMEAVDSQAFRMYWQPNQFRSEEENISYARLLAPYTVNIHVFNWQGREKYPLAEAADIWKRYLGCFDGRQNLLLEFMPDGRLESLAAEAKALKEIVT